LAPAAEPAKFVAPQQSLSFEDEGTLAGYQQGFLQIRDSKMEQWLLKIVPETTVSVTGEAERGYLRPGLNIEFAAQFDKKGIIQGPIEEVEIITSPGKPALGLFVEGDDGSPSKAVRTVSAGSYRVKGKLASFKDPDITVAIGSKRITGTLGEEVKIKFTSDDPSLAEVGDSVKVSAWYYPAAKPVLNQAGRAVAESITITLAKPLAAAAKRGRQFERSTKAAAKEK
jgi:hypothetical protein